MASDGTTQLRIPLWTWARLIFDLRRRSAGGGESGAFLLGRNGSIRITAYICYDELDPEAYQGGGIAFHAAGYAALWQLCKAKRLQVLADAHTHPTANVSQSPIDMRHPMVPVIGHTAMIVPSLGKTPWWSLKAVGIYEYLGNFKWRAHAGRPCRVRLGLW